MTANLWVSTTAGDADWVVKLIDVYPDDHPNFPHNPEHIKMGGYQQMVRSEVFRGRFRNSYEKPAPFTPNEITNVRFELQDVLHTFKTGHRIMVQIQSTWFPLVDRNPQKWVDNIFKADAEDFVKATHRVYRGATNQSSIEVSMLKQD
jgi:predicted acyl esterase